MDTYQELLDSVILYCKEKTNDTAYTLWFKPMEMISFDATTAVLKFANSFKKSTVVSRYGDLITEAFAEVCGFDVDVKFICPEDKLSDEEKNEKETRDYKNELLTFDNFIVGPNNEFAYTAAKSIAADPAGRISKVSVYNPLFIYGNSGLGKTHLLNAIRYEVERNYPEMKITYVNAENFTNEFISALGKKNIDEFHDKYRRNIDLFLVDDVQFIAGRIQTEEEFFHTFNTLIENGKQIVLTSDRPPKEIKSLQERLCSRFESGLMADIQSPEFETRCAIIKRKAQLLDFEINDNVVTYIAEYIKTNIRQLEGITKRLQAMCKYSGQTPTIASAQIAIRDVQNDVRPVNDVVKDIVDEVSRTTGVSVEDIYSKKQSSDVSNARKMCFHIIREVTDMSFKAIGEKFGRDHSTVMYNVESFVKKLKTDTSLAYQVSDIIKNIKAL